MNLVARATQLINRRTAAARLGLHYGRGATFQVPSTIRIAGRPLVLAIPQEAGQRTAFVELLLDDCYCLRKIARQADIATVLDIGANVGLFSIAARAAFPSARIHAYEPNIALMHYLSSHARQTGFDYFTEAVGREAGRVSLVANRQQSVLSSTRREPDGTITQVAFRTALDRLDGRADLVKLDCEGAEWRIFEDHASWSRVRFVTMEYHLGPGDGHHRIVGALHALGFHVRHHHPVTNFGLVLAERLR